MLEAGDALETYRLDLPPDRVDESGCTATRINDHPRRFLVYQGSVNNGLGNVKLTDSGTYTLIQRSGDSYRLDFEGKTLRGAFSLIRAKGDTWKFSRSEDVAGPSS